MKYILDEDSNNHFKELIPLHIVILLLILC